ncbi:MAG: zinc-ribbon domain-containing protein [Pyrinomonadaceae bacterium]
MTIVCPNCSARLQLNDAKTPAGNVTVRCPKCQKTVEAQSSGPTVDHSGLGRGKSPATEHARFERATAAPPFRLQPEDTTANSSSAGSASVDNLDNAARLLVELLHRSGISADRKARRQSERRRLLVCATPEHRETVARLLAQDGYEVFVAENTTQALESMRGDKMDIVLLDPQFDPLEQGVAFVTREVNIMRPADRRRLFFVSLSATVRTYDLHAAFLNSVNLVVSPLDLEKLPGVLEIALRDFNELYREFNAVNHVDAL